MPITINTAQKPPPKSNEPRAENKLITWLIEAAIIILAIVIMVVVRQHVYDVAIVTSRSMEPTLMVGDRVIFDHRRSLAGKWQRGDVIFFDPPETWPDEDGMVLVKRIVGLPGETIEVKNGHIYANGQDIQIATHEDAEDNMGPRILGKDQYFVLGDNRANSEDSRTNGPISANDIRGRTVFRLWPAPGRLGIS
jgi:signal peptidase I